MNVSKCGPKTCSCKALNPDMKRLPQWALRFALALVAAVILALLARDFVLRASLERNIRAQTGLDVRIGKVSSGLFSPAVTIRNLKLLNTAEFGGAPFLDVPELHVEFDPAALRQRQLHITLLRFNLNEVEVVKNQRGRTNVIDLLQKLSIGATDTNRVPQWLRAYRFTGIDRLDLTLGKARYIDLNDARNNRELELNLRNQLFTNVKSEGDVYGILFMMWLRSGGNLLAMPKGAAPPGPSPPVLHPGAIETAR